MSLIESQPPTLPAAGDNLAVNAVRIPVKDSRWSQDGFVRLEFENWTDLSTKLVMLPRIEAEGRGAVIASYDSKEQDSKSHVQKISSNQNLEDSSPAENRDDSGGDHSLQQQGEEVYEGLVFEGIQNKQDSWREKDFTDILALLREERNSPLVLCFSITQQSEQSGLDVEGEEKKENDVPSKSEQSSAFQRNGKEATVSPQESLQAGMSALSSWGMRVRAQASEAATNLSTVAKTLQGPPKDTIQTKLKEKACDIYLQTSVGAYVPVSRAQSKVTTSSLLFIRKSATEAPPRKGWSYQWYRSTIVGEKQFDDAASSASNRTYESSGNSTASPVDPFPVTGEIEWIAINGASGASFQPDATTIGRKLRCILTMQQNEDTISSDESSECTDDNCSDLASVEDTEEICEINGVVQADPTLFNGARTALARGAKFGGLKGRGNAEGRQFRLEVSIGMPSRKRSRRTTSALHIFQMSGNESISLTSAPILGTTARIVGTSPKYMDLQIAVPAESVLSALCTNGYFQVETPNRLSRESFLMTLGIANYQGKPADLDTQTVLFRDRPPLQLTSLVDEEVSQVMTPRPARKLTDPVASPEFMISPIASVTTLPSSPISSPNHSFMATSHIATTKTEEQSLIAAMEEEIQFLRGKLTRKDKVVSELQRQITQSDSAHEDTRQKLRACQKDLEHSKKEQQGMTHKLKKTENSIQSHEDKLNRIEGEHAQQVSVLSATIERQNTKIADLEKSNKVLRNDKAILQATVEARDSKLVRMTALHSSYDELAVKISQQDEIKAELEASQKQCTDMQQTVLQVESSEKDCRSNLEAAQKTIAGLKEQVELERSKVLSCKAQVDPLQKSIQQLKGERNSYKQKNDSLSKEVSRLCKNGRSIKDIERIVNEYQSLSEEIESLRKQKKKALEEAHEYRTSYAQSKAAQALSGVEQETQAALERNVELSRLLAETTEYINAKEMQLETMKQVNEQLQDEIRSLARANLGKNEI